MRLEGGLDEKTIALVRKAAQDVSEALRRG
jgi:hypothetical protein